MSSFSNFSTHAPTGASQKAIVSPNQYADSGRNIGFPNKYSVYVNKISEVDGTQRVTEYRTVSEIIGNRLYLWHRPLTNAGAVTQVTVAGGGAPVIDTTATNPKSAYIVFTTLPTNDFTVSYLAAPDCINAWNLNTIQDDVMEMQKTLGVTSLTGTPGLRNLAYATFDLPGDAGISGVAQRAVYLSHLARNIVIGSTDVASLKTSLGSSHTIQIGRTGDELIFDATGFHVVQSNANYNNNITLGTKTGDLITYKGSISGEGQVTIGGPSWTNIGAASWNSRGYSGCAFHPTSGLTATYYSGSMLRVHGDVAIAGNVRSVGALTVVTSTGETSVVLGDWTVARDLIVQGKSFLNGGTETSTAKVTRDLTVEGVIEFPNSYSVIDGLDPSAAAETLPLLSKRRLKNSIIDAPMNQRQITPKLSITSPYYRINNSGLVGDVFTITGIVAGTPITSGAHQAVVQIDVALPIVSGSFTGLIPWTGVGVSTPPSGAFSGIWSPGMMDPGFIEIALLGSSNATAPKFPVYGYFINEVDNASIKKMQLLLPTNLTTARDFFTPGSKVSLYNPGTVPYDFISAQGGASPSFQVSGLGTSPLQISFDTLCKQFTSISTNISMLNVLENSAAYSRASNPTGIAYIFAGKPNGPDSDMSFFARAVSNHSNDEVPIGEIVASSGVGNTWTILETTCYRPNGLYDSAWMPIVRKCLKGLNSGRFIPEASETGQGFNEATRPNSPYTYFFQHNLGPIQDLRYITADMYLASTWKDSAASFMSYQLTGSYSGYNQTHTDLYQFYSTDWSGPIGKNGGIYGGFTKQSISPNRTYLDNPSSADLKAGRDANIFYIDSRIVGIQFYSGVFEQLHTGAIAPSSNDNHYKYLRIVMRRDV